MSDKVVIYRSCVGIGNTPIGRAIAEKALAQGAGQPSLTALSLLIQRRRKDYYAQLAGANKSLEVEPWLDWFADLVLAAQDHTLEGLDFLLANIRLFDRLRGQLKGTRYWLVHGKAGGAETPPVKKADERMCLS
jgi:Fic family protein